MMTTLLSSLLLGVVILQGAAQQPASEVRPQTGEIRGRVTDGESGQPIARAIIRLTRPGSSDEIAGRTDDAGLYRFAGLAAGEYDGLVEPGEFRSTHLMGSLTAASDRGWIALKAGEVREVNIALPRARAINVRVVDPWGEPLSALQVIAKSPDGRRGRPFPSFLSATDDHGRLRIFGLQPGAYIVCAETGGYGVSERPGSEHGREGWLRTCYPSAADEAEAERVRVDRADAGELEIRMRLGRTFRITGRIVDASGAPASGAFASFSRFHTNGSSASGIVVDADGRFAMTSVHPGEYAIEASMGGPERPEHRRPFEAGFLPIRVVDTDLEELVVYLIRGVDVPGWFILEDAAAAMPPVPGSGLMVSARLADDRLPGSGSTRTALARDDRAFTLTGMFGRRSLEVLNVPRGWYAKSIRYGGREIIDETIQFEGGTDAPSLEVVLSNRGASVNGRVFGDDGKPAGGALVLVFRAGDTPSDARLVSSARSSSAGVFRIGPARGGDYLVVALPASASIPQQGEWARVARLAAAAERITLGDLDERTLDITVVNER